MLFTKPCCAKLEEALTEGEKRNFSLIVEPETVLFLAICWAPATPGPGGFWYDTPIYYCPFCGTQLQTEAAVESWRQKHMKDSP